MHLDGYFELFTTELGIISNRTLISLQHQMNVFPQTLYIHMNHFFVRTKEIGLNKKNWIDKSCQMDHNGTLSGPMEPESMNSEDPQINSIQLLPITNLFCSYEKISLNKKPDQTRWP